MDLTTTFLAVEHIYLANRCLTFDVVLGLELNRLLYRLSRQQQAQPLKVKCSDVIMRGPGIDP